MPDFGFSISKGRTMDFDLCDRTGADLIEEISGGLKRCMECGSCTATCSAGQFSDFNIRRIHTLFRRGKYDGLQEALAGCMLCGKCTLVCPRSVNLRQSIIKMRTLLSEVPQRDDDLQKYLNVL